MTRKSLTLTLAALAGVAALASAATFAGRPGLDAEPGGELVARLRAAVEASGAPAPARQVAELPPVLAPVSVQAAPDRTAGPARVADRAADTAEVIARDALVALLDSPRLPGPVSQAEAGAPVAQASRATPAATRTALRPAEPVAEEQTGFALPRSADWQIDSSWIAASGSGPVILEVRPLPRAN